MAKTDSREVTTSFICKKCGSMITRNVYPSEGKTTHISCNYCSTIYKMTLTLTYKKG